ncbi:Hypothetical_protein [Hexamita inflata]|uniref:Hypothetical_protein n=1 Tax=Hexamita inflata TaxID=28002 RepID=A0AA86QKZ3_9EUKA|nr:Hypothetical protein HINF_LOCUS46092 [Hexamita inflata]
MNYSLTQEGQKYDFDRIRPQSTIQSRYLIFQKGKIEITTCNKRTDGNDKNKRGRRCLGKVNQFSQQTQAVLKFVFSFLISTFQSTKLLLFMKDFISKIYGGQVGLEKRIRGSNNWCTDATCNLQLVAQALNLQRTSMFIYTWVKLIIEVYTELYVYLQLLQHSSTTAQPGLDVIEALYKSIVNRVNECIDEEGEHTHY